jgi:DNA-nicking Smr family endonuclease
MPDDPTALGPFNPPLQPPLEDVLDLHTFQPRELPLLLDDYLCACARTGMTAVRIVHGKGRGVLRARVHRLLHGHPRVAAFETAPPEAGGWGATLVWLRPTRDGDFGVDCPEA